MPGQSVELIRKIFPPEIDMAEVMRSDDPVAALVVDADVVLPDLEVTFAAPHTGGPGLRYRGIDGLIEGWRDWLTPWESYVIEIEDFIEAGHEVVMLARVRARTSRDGVELEHRPAAVWTVRGGTVSAVTFFLEHDEALEYSGLAPP
jgi:ketosteroid isomerase-like protein